MAAGKRKTVGARFHGKVLNSEELYGVAWPIGEFYFCR